MIKRKRKEPGIHWWHIIIIIIFFGLIFLFYFLHEGGIKENLKLKGEIKNLKAELNELNKKNTELEKEIEKIKKNPDYLIEKVAREELHMKKDGEKVIYFKKDSK